MEKAKRFAVLVAEAVRDLPGVDARFFGFTDTVIYDAGDADRPAAVALEANGGNNDAAGLFHAAKVGRRSKRTARLLVMISDGLPTECTAASLTNLVHQLTRDGFACTQVAVAPISSPCFPDYVEVTDDDEDAAVRAFGRLAAKKVTRLMR